MTLEPSRAGEHERSFLSSVLNSLHHRHTRHPVATELGLVRSSVFGSQSMPEPGRVVATASALGVACS